MIEKFNLNDMIKGWFIGDFEPSLYKTEAVEVAVKSYNSGDFEEEHYHKIATEFTVVIEGIVELNDIQYGVNDIIKIEPGTSAKFKSITKSLTVVVKIPGVKNDKFITRK
jgi:hypothetical protein